MLSYPILQILEELCDACGPAHARVRLAAALVHEPQTRAVKALRAALTLPDDVAAMTTARAIAGITEPV